MSKRITIGYYNAGPYCGASIFRLRDWKRYGLFRKTKTGFSIGPVLFWKEIA